MKTDFVLAVENSTASVVSNKNLQCGNYQELICSSFSKNGAKALLCYEKGWYEAGKQIKDLICGVGITCFCLDDNVPFEKKAVKLLDSVQSLQEIVVVGDEQMALFALKYCTGKALRVIYIPLDYSFASYLLFAVQRGKDDLLLIDESLLLQCGKNKLADGIRTVLSKKLFFVEMLVNQAIEGDIPNEKAEILLNNGQKSLTNYLKSGRICDLVIALVLSVIGESCLRVGNVVRSASELLLRMQSLSLSGEREYLLYKMVLRAYELYFLNDTTFTLSIPGVVLEEAEIKSLYASDYAQPKIYLPKYIYDFDAIESLKKKVMQNGELLKEIKAQLAQIEGDSITLKKQYGGRKYSVEHYNAKQRAKALYLAPYITEKPTAFHLLFASGVTQYLK